MKPSLLLLLLFLYLPARSQNQGDSIFNATAIHEIYLTFTQPSYWDSLTAYYLTDQYMQADMVVNGISYPTVGVKFKGNSSYNNPFDKKPFKIDMNEFVTGQDIDGLKKFNLNNNFKDPSFLREKLTCDFYLEHGMRAPRCTFAKLYINGTYWGLYNFIEEVDTKQYLNTQFGNNEGNLFKGDPTGDLKWVGSSPAGYYNKYELHTNETINDWTDLVYLIDKINNSGVYFYDSLETILNTNAFISQWAGLNLFSNLDSYIGSGHNYYIYHDTVSRKFEWIAWDVNESFGNFKLNMTTAQIKNLSITYVNGPAGNRPLVEKMLLNSVYLNQLKSTLCQWIQSDFSNNTLDAKIDSLANVIRTAVYADTKKFYTNQNFEDNLSIDITAGGQPPAGGTYIGLKSFITARRASLISQLTGFCTVGVAESNASEASVTTYPNPADNILQIYSPVENHSTEITLLNTFGQPVAVETMQSGSLSIDVSSLSDGIYLLLINDKVTGKVVVHHK